MTNNKKRRTLKKQFKYLLIITFVVILILIINSNKTLTQNIRLTYYYPNDPTGSTETTASGLDIEDFNLNEKGWYTYNDKVVIAAAINRCTLSTTGICSNYNVIPNNYNQFNIYDEVSIMVENIEYPAIILDICGASYWKEEYQRYDIFVKNKNFPVDSLGILSYKIKIYQLMYEK
jgi:hypothetical protein